MTKYILTLIICLFVSSLSAQQTDGFEDKLSDFRYSLYQDIANAVSDSLPDVADMDKIIYGNPVISMKIKDFMNENKQEIVAYKTGILKQKEDKVKIDTTLYDADLPMLNDLSLFFDDEVFKGHLPTDILSLEFMTLRPSATGDYINSLISGRRSVQSTLINSFASQIASHKLFSRHINDNLWEVVYDFYWNIIVVEMDVSKGILSTKLKAIYRLKGLPDII